MGVVAEVAEPSIYPNSGESGYPKINLDQNASDIVSLPLADFSRDVRIEIQSETNPTAGIVTLLERLMDREDFGPSDGGWPSLFEDGKLPETIEVDSYKGTELLALSCTQLPGKPSRQKRIVKEWCEFFQRPSPVRRLVIGTRLPVPLFEAVCCQSELTCLFIKWGPIKDLSPIANLTKLRELHLGSCSVEDLSPIGELTGLKHVFFENLDRMSDYSALAKLTELEYLGIEGDAFAPKKVWIDDLEFLAGLTQLRGLDICAARFRDAEYLRSLRHVPNLEYLSLPNLDDVTRDQIAASLPNLKYGNVISPEE